MVKVTPILTPRKVLNITYQSAQETLLGTPQTLPTSEPSTPQVSYTTTSVDLPAFSITPFAKTWVAYIYAAGKFVTSGTLSWRMKKNGGNVKTGTASVAANTYYTISAYFYNPSVGNVLEIALWSNQTDSNYDYKAYQTVFTRLILMNKPRLLRPCNFTSMANKPVLTLGNPSVKTTGVSIPWHDNIYLYYNFTTPTNFTSLYVGSTGFIHTEYGDYTQNIAAVNTHASYRPYYNNNAVPTQIVMRGVIVD